MPEELSETGSPKGAAEGSQGQTAKPCRPWDNFNVPVRALLWARRKDRNQRRRLSNRAPSGRPSCQSSSPGAARYALAPGYLMPRLRRSLPLIILEVVFLVVIIPLATPLVAAKEAQPAEDPQIEQRMHALTQQLRCLVCQNETLADSQADLAEDLRRQVREQMKAGKSDQEIIAFLTERYGDFVLYRPPVKSTTYLLWFGPFILLPAGLWVLYSYVRRRRELIHARPLTSDERRRAEDLLRSQVE